MKNNKNKMVYAKKMRSLKQFINEFIDIALAEQQMATGGGSDDRTVVPPKRQQQIGGNGKVQLPAQQRQSNDNLEQMISGLQAQFAEIDAHKLAQSKKDPTNSKNISRISDLVAELQGLLKPIQEQNAVGAGGIVGMPNKAIELEENADVEQPTIQFFKQAVMDAVGDAPWCKGVGLGIDKRTGEKVVVVSVDLNKIEVDDILLHEIAESSEVPAKFIRIRGFGKIVAKKKQQS